MIRDFFAPPFLMICALFAAMIVFCVYVFGETAPPTHRCVQSRTDLILIPITVNGVVIMQPIWVPTCIRYEPIEKTQ